MMHKRADDKPMVKSGAPLLIIITLILVMYIIFLPPDERAELLSEPSVSGPHDPETIGVNGSVGGSIGVGSADEFIFAGPGYINEVGRSTYDHKIPAVRLRASQEAKVIYTDNPFVVSYNSFTHVTHTSQFSIEDPSLLSDAMLVLSTPRHSGTLTVMLNGHRIYAKEISGQPEPISIPSSLLLQSNVLFFDVDSPGWAFWRTNRYAIDNLRIQATVKDRSEQAVDLSFTIRQEEANALEDVKFQFVPECKQLEVGKLTATVNGKQIFAQTPDCGTRSSFDVDKSYVRAGVNTLRLETEKGTVLVDAINIRTSTDVTANDVTYFFELDEDLFQTEVEVEEVCGEIDGYCPDDCSEDVDKDCCFAEYTHAYWCDVSTQFSNDRCVGSITNATMYRCSSGYEDDDGDLPNGFNHFCGNDNDNFCPLGCSRFYDKDCCLEQNSDRFWCDDVPVTGVIDVCKDELSSDACRLCPDGYEGEDRDPSCSYDSRNSISEEDELKSSYRIVAEFYFVDDSRTKSAEVIVNGYTTSFDTRKAVFERDISNFVRDGSNYISVRPRSEFGLAELRVDIERT